MQKQVLTFTKIHTACCLLTRQPIEKALMTQAVTQVIAYSSHGQIHNLCSLSLNLCLYSLLCLCWVGVLSYIALFWLQRIWLLRTTAKALSLKTNKSSPVCHHKQARNHWAQDDIVLPVEVDVLYGVIIGSCVFECCLVRLRPALLLGIQSQSFFNKMSQSFCHWWTPIDQGVSGDFMTLFSKSVYV